MKKHVYLLGFMGCGKSYLGRQLSEQLYCPFSDLDQLIENKSQSSINDIFSKHGEAHFRILEQKALHETLHMPPRIIATGGGTACFFDNIDWMNKHGITIFLDTHTSVLVQRLSKGKSKRPLLKDLSQNEMIQLIDQKLTARRPFYEQAHLQYNIHSNGQNSIGDIIHLLDDIFTS